LEGFIFFAFKTGRDDIIGYFLPEKFTRYEQHHVLTSNILELTFLLSLI